LTYSSSVDQVVTILSGVGYARVSVPFSLAGLIFNVAAAMIGTDRSSDLVIIEDTVETAPREIQVRIESIARAMDVLDSKRPITAILVGPHPSASELEAISRVSRVLPIGTASVVSQDEGLRNCLAVLMPLPPFSTGGQLANPLTELSDNVDATDSKISELIDAAPLGAAAVATRLRTIIERCLNTQQDSEER
jgi:hypothetical protein